MTAVVLARRLGYLAAAVGASAGGLTLGLAPKAPGADDRAALADVAERVPPRGAQLALLKARGAAAAADGPELDVLVVGGGATGCAAALDARLRGLQVALVERDDFASGTSSRSTKLIHGGVRYLEKAFFQLDPGQLKLVFEALHERAVMLRQAPHLTAPLPTLLPCYKLWEVPFYWVGLKAYDFVAAVGSGFLYMSKYVSAGEAMRQFPTLSHTSFDGEKLRGSIMYYDGQMDDARFNVGLALTAALYGATIANHTEVVHLLTEEAEGESAAPKVVGARVRDVITKDEFDVRAKVVINATGPFTDAVRNMESKDANPMIVPSAGVHITLPSYYSPDGMGLIVPKTKDGRIVFMLPWLGRTIAGTTDSSTEITELPRPHEDEVAFILDALADYLRLDVRTEDVQSAWSGIRPLAVNPDADAGSTQNILREHAVHVSPGDVVTITGGKWTTQRAMGEAAVDKAVEVAGLAGKATNCKTPWVTLVGGDKWDNKDFTFLSQEYKLDVEVSKHLSRAYGDQADKVAKLCEAGLGARLVPDLPVVEAEVVYCVENEYCCTAVDFLARRSRLAFLDAAGARKALPRVAEIMAQQLKWSRGEKASQIAKANTFLDSFCTAMPAKA